MPYLWAAYRMGTFGNFQVGLDRNEFRELIFGTIHGLFKVGGDAFALLAKRGDGTEAVMGVVTVMPHQLQMWPHVNWFPWSTLRNRIECALRFLLETKERCNLIIVASPKDVDFFLHLCRYGVVRRIGTGRGWLGEHNVVLFETVRRLSD